MESLIIPTLSAVVMLGLYLRRKSQSALTLTLLARVALWAGLILQGLYAAFWLLFDLHAIIASPLTGLIHLVPALTALMVAYCAYHLPLEGGVVLAGEGLVLAAYTGLVMDPGVNWLPAILFAAAPALLSGLLLLWAAALAIQASSATH